MMRTKAKDKNEVARMPKGELEDVVRGIETIPLTDKLKVSSISTWSTLQTPTTNLFRNIWFFFSFFWVFPG
jgi:hypothetical protein